MGSERRRGERGEERRGERERKGVALCGHICNTRARLAGSERAISHTPVGCCLAGMGRWSQLSRGVREEKVCRTLKCSQFTILGHSFSFLLLFVTYHSKTPEVRHYLFASLEVPVKLKMQYCPLYLITLPATKEGL